MFGLPHLTLADEVQDHFLSLAPKQKQNKKPTTTTIINSKKKKTEQNAHTQTKNKNKKKKHKSSTGGHNPSFLYALTASRNTLNIVGVQECHKRENGVSICHFRSCPIKGCNRKRNRKALDLVICHHLRSTKDTASKNRLQYVESQ